ncbi:MAG: ABC transporter permease [Pseudomonadota bacterium]
MTALSLSLPHGIFQAALAFAFLSVPFGIAVLLSWGYAPWPLIRANIRRHRALTATFVLLIAVAVALGVAVTTQERGLRQGTAQAATGFDIIVAAPGSELEVMLATIFLEPADMGLVDGTTFMRLHDHPRVTLAAPVAFGDSYRGAPVIGTTGDFLRHLTGDPKLGQVFGDTFDAAAGVDAPVAPGDVFVPAHGHGEAAQDIHADEYKVVARLPRTGTPWDQAILVPVEAVWRTHGLSDGHTEPGQLGPPFAPALFPGTPAVILQVDSLAAAYALRSEYTRDGQTMAFFPGEVLSRLYVVLGDIRQIMSILSIVTQLLVAIAVILALAILSRLSLRRTAMLRALGAPRRFLTAVIWGHATGLLVAGTALGLMLGLAGAALLSAVISSRTGIAVDAQLGWPELHLSLGFLALSSGAALLSAFLTSRIDAAANLRG